MAERTQNDIMRDFSKLCGELSPENLTCDGELSRSEIKAKTERIWEDWHDLELELGRDVSKNEVETYIINNWREKR